MARFGRDFVRAATQPAYMEGLFTAAQNIGAAPARRQAAKKQADLEKGLLGLEQMALSGEMTPEMYKEAVGSYSALMRQNPEQAGEIRKSLARIGASVRQQGNQQNTIKAKSELERLKQAAISVQMSEGLSTEQKQENLARFRVEAQKIIDSNPNIDLTSYSNFTTDVEREVYDLFRIKTAQETKQAVEGFSNQLFQIKDYEALGEKTDSLLEANPEYAEEIKRVSNIQQQSIENREKRERLEEERGYDIGGSVTDLQQRAKDLPDLAQGVRQGVLDKLKAAEDIQKQYRNNTGWTNTAARDRARELIRLAEQDIDSYVSRVAVDNISQLRNIDNDLQQLISTGPATLDFGEVEEEAEGMSLIETGKKLSDLSSSDRKKYMDTARKELLERNKAAHATSLATLRARRASITGEKPKEPEKVEETSKFLNPVSKEAVEAARANGQTDAQIRRTFQKMGVDNTTIIELLFD